MREAGSEELEDASGGIWVGVGGRLDGAPEDGGASEALKAVLEGVREGEGDGESDCWRDGSSGSAESTGAPAVAVGLGGCGGVGS